LLLEIQVPHHHAGVDFACQPLARIGHGWLATSITEPWGKKETEIRGVVPDGVSYLTVRKAGGSLRIAVQSNSYDLRTLRPTRASFLLDGQRITVPLPQAPR
jgi:hypothetical protein